MNYYLALFFIVILKVCLISCQSQCKNFQTCGGCIGFAHEKCVWCPAENHTGRRCHSKSTLDLSWCKTKVYDPEEHVVIISDKDLNDGKNNSEIIQLKPQAVKIKARTNVPIKINISYKPAEGYPLDVYYLVDSSDTMKTYKEKLYDQGMKIYERLSKITNNVRLGVGSFIEKPSLPYVDITDQTSYSFTHHQSLTNETKLFSKALQDLKEISGTNNDEPEADLDALMQAMVCKEIGWRPNSHRIIILTTDSTYHSAGDGKFVGALKPHDMKCYLDKNVYSMALTFDYPSVSQINKIATENNIMIIFAADPKVRNDYMALEKQINNAKYVQLLLNKDLSDDVVEMIIKEYKELFSSVQIDASSTPPFMSLTFDPDCTQKGKCSYKTFINPVKIVGTLTIKSCPTDGKYNYEVKIGPVSIDEKLTLHVEVDCQCECEKHGEKNSDKCSKAGSYKCGICYCNENSHGEICNCNGTFTTAKDFDKCKTNPDDPKPCSGRGDCRCGTCINCQEGFSGDFCEFDDNSCERPGGVLCAGHGKCTYGKCECEPNWLPPNCRCPNNNNSCIAPNSKEQCSGRGTCVCGQCVCRSATKDDEYCVGKFCDECPESAAKRCLELGDYAYCNFKENKRVCDEKYINLTDTEVILASKEDIYSHKWYIARMWCRKVLEDERILVFRYYYPKSSTSSNLRLIIIQDELDMPPVADVWVAVGSVIGTVLLIGIITIVAWKILVDLHDKREYEKFKQDSAKAGYDVSHNPLYHSPQTNFLNPAYNNTS